jgi:nucleotide-binding universal stress UspA family protein
MFERILVPLDGSSRAEAAMLPAARLIANLSAPRPAALHLTRVVGQAVAVIDQHPQVQEQVKMVTLPQRIGLEPVEGE